MLQFGNPIVAGVVLVRPAIQSPDYVAGVSGWTINQDGTAEFNSGTFRGTVTAGVFEGADFIINPAGHFFYSGTPALGNLIFSIASASGTDSFGNAYVGPGAVAYGGTGQPYVVMSSDFEGSPCFALPSNRPMEAPFGAAAFLSFVTNQGLANEFLGVFLNGPFGNSPNGRNVTVKMFSDAKNGSLTAQGSLDYFDDSGNDFTELVWGNGGLFLRYVENMSAQDPTVTGVPTDEVWHPLSLASGLTGTLRYKRLAESNFVCIDGALTFSYTTSAQTFTCGSMRSAVYYPTVSRLFPVAMNGTPSGITASIPRLFVGTSGGVQLLVPSGSGTGATASFTQMIPLD